MLDDEQIEHLMRDPMGREQTEALLKSLPSDSPLHRKVAQKRAEALKKAVSDGESTVPADGDGAEAEKQ